MIQLSVLAVALVAAQTAPEPSGRTARRTPIVSVVQRAGPSVVNISTRAGIRKNPFSRLGARDDFFGRFFGRREQEESLGSGVVIHDEGLVLTNEHVVARATDITVTFADRRSLAADVVGADRDFDIAVLKLRDVPEDLPVARIGRSSDLMIGETVVAIGNPFGLTNTVTTGVVSALHRSIPAGERTYEDFVQTDAAINPGNSGGALLNVLGELIGINTAIYAGGNGIGFAIPIDKAMAVVEEVLRYGEVRPAYVGVRVAADRSGGALVKSVDPDGPAAQAGLQVGDRIIDLGGQQVRSGRDFMRVQQALVPGQNVAVTVQRDQREISIELPVIELDRDRAVRQGRARLGLTVKARRGTLVITRVEPRSAADQVGIRRGDQLIAVAGQRIRSEAAYEAFCAAVYNATSVVLRIGRGRTIYRVTLPLTE